MKYLFVYRMCADTGFAPCVDDGFLTLACCKGGHIRKGKPCNTGIRFWIGSKKDGIDYQKDEMYVLGTFKDKFLYLARIENVELMEDYFKCLKKHRTDMIYKFENNNLKRNDYLQKEGVHITNEENIRDIAGKYVLESKDYIYLGKDAVEIDVVGQYNAKHQETKIYNGYDAEKIIAECKKYNDGKTHKPNDPIKKICGVKK